MANFQTPFLKQCAAAPSQYRRMHRGFGVEYGFQIGSALLLGRPGNREMTGMSSAAEPQHDPTMEEILASIRKIISEDQPISGRKASPATAEKDSDILELTEEVPPEPAMIRPPVDAAAPILSSEPHPQSSSMLSD